MEEVKDNSRSPDEKKENQSGSPKYWLSLEQWKSDPEFKKLAQQEFLSSPLQSSDGEGGWARREFLKLMGASMALTSFGCVRRPAQKIVPYVKRPTEMVMGLANYYASTFVDANEGFGILVKTREGRPIKVEGNSLHPVNLGGMSARAHAHILALYDPDRLGGPKQNLLNQKKTNRDTIRSDWDKLDAAVGKAIAGGGVGVLTSSLYSPSTNSLVTEFVKATGAKRYTWEPLSEEALREGQKQSFGRDVVPRPRLDKADLIVSVGADFLGTYLSPTEFNRQFSERRKPGAEMSKLVVFESLYTLTGANADVRARVKSSELLDVVLGLAYEIVIAKGRSRYATDPAVKRILDPYKGFAQRSGIDAAMFSQLADDLWGKRGQSLVISGGMQGQTQDAVALQVATNFLNTVLENDGKTIDYSQPYTGYQGSAKDMNQLIADLKSGQIKTLIVHGVNPVYALPASAGFVEALQKAGTVIYTGTHMDETGLMSDFVAPDHHPLENWGDAEIVDGVYSIQQPTIQPLNNTRAFQDSLIKWAAAAKKTTGSLAASSWYNYLRDNWKQNIHGRNRRGELGQMDFENFWTAFLEKGVFEVSGNASSAPRNFNAGSLRMIENRAARPKGTELVLYATSGLKDGSLANVPWLQEFPDPVTKICWDNYLTVSPKKAEEMALSHGQVVVLTVGKQKVSAPVAIQPGQHDDVVGLAVGYGRKAAGEVANGVGVNAYPLAQFANNGVVYSALSATVEKTGQHMQLANPQGHHSMEGRNIIIEATLEQYKKDPGANIHRHKMFSLWSEHKYPGHKWGMTIDLSTCTGCSACVIACQSENNIPVVGKRYVMQGREMHWIRIDRYYTGDVNDPDSVFMPVVCQHCDNAPCETVCPVAATVHGPEGTNDMIYNRCVGTRYCANNCPYKVRRFNWFNFNKVKAPMEMAMNPEVTVRARGVMEKCTFCIHRIQSEKMQARNEGRAIKDGDIKTACQESCPTNAIIFGDMNDPNSQLSQQFKAERAYALLEEINTQPAVRYLTKIRNADNLKSSGHGNENDNSGKGGH